MSDEIDITDWPDCIVPGCTRKACLALRSPRCFPHTPGNEHVKRMKIDANRIALGLEVAEIPEDLETSNG